MIIGNHKIAFDKELHQYKDENGVILTSASSLISEFEEPFDKDGRILQACALKNKITPEEMQRRWDKIRDDACDRGTGFHKQVECFIKNGTIQNGPDYDLVEKFSKIKFHGKLESEVILYNLNYSIAGTTDLVELVSDTVVNVYDFKTNKKIEKYSPYGKKMLYPLEHLDDCTFNKYSLQLSLYAFMLEELGYFTNKLAIFHITKDRNIIKYDIKYLKKDILKMLEYKIFIDL